MAAPSVAPHAGATPPPPEEKPAAPVVPLSEPARSLILPVSAGGQATSSAEKRSTINLNIRHQTHHGDLLVKLAFVLSFVFVAVLFCYYLFPYAVRVSFMYGTN